MKNFTVEFYNEQGKLDHSQDYSTVEEAVDESRDWQKKHTSEKKALQNHLF